MNPFCPLEDLLVFLAGRLHEDILSFYTGTFWKYILKFSEKFFFCQKYHNFWPSLRRIFGLLSRYLYPSFRKRVSLLWEVLHVFYMNLLTPLSDKSLEDFLGEALFNFSGKNFWPFLRRFLNYSLIFFEAFLRRKFRSALRRYFGFPLKNFWYVARKPFDGPW